jgi:protocatechuate 3,4-dioxygenase beta subunit
MLQLLKLRRVHIITRWATQSDKTSPNSNSVCSQYALCLILLFYHRHSHQLLDIGVIDVDTCQPLPNVLVDIWHANATGHYAGHPDPAPHLVDEKPATEGRRKGLRTAYPRTNTVETWLRGAWPTNAKGVAQFSSEYFRTSPIAPRILAHLH